MSSSESTPTRPPITHTQAASPPSRARAGRWALLTLSLVIAGCGGSSDRSGTTEAVVRAESTDLPRVYRSLVAGQRTELSPASLGVATGAGDTLALRQLGGPAAGLSTPDAQQLVIDVPAVATAAELALELVVTRDSGDEERLPITVTAVNSAQVVEVPSTRYRLDAAPDVGECRAPPPPPSTSPARLTRAFPGITLPSPVDMDQAPGDPQHWYVSSLLAKKIYRFPDRDDATDADVVLDLNALEGRLRSIAFHPDFADNGRVYIQLHNGKDLREGTTIREYTWSQALDAFDPATERIILQVELPHADSSIGEHPGGQLNFGNDGYLYSALGDGTQPGVFSQFSQDTDLLWGSMLRIDVDNGDPYTIPGDNPFATGGGRPEIYAWGFRHPWKWNFDRATGEIWLADVGWVSREEVNRVVAGGNYGWPLREGQIACPRCEVEKITVSVDADSFVEPVIDYDRETGKSITGGYVYRGASIPDLTGVYVFGDYITGKVFALRPDGSGAYAIETIAQASISLVSFAEDSEGELYALDFKTGYIHALLPNSEQPADDFPSRLSQTGCVDMAEPERALPGLIPYSVQSPLWSDGADKGRWLSLPGGARIDRMPDSAGDFELPPGTVLVKHFRLFNRMIETRLFMRHDDGQWAGYSYAWDDSETEAWLLPGASVRDVDGQQWRYPSRSECLQCHTRAAGWSLGLTTRQLNTHQFDGESLYSQLRMFDELDLLDFEPDYNLDHPVLDNGDASVAARARAYLDVNCAGCHRPGGGGDRSTMDLRRDTPLAAMNLCNARPIVDTLGNPQARLLQPGEPANSILLARMQRRDAYRMPPIGSAIVDAEAVALVADWIGSLQHCE